MWGKKQWNNDPQLLGNRIITETDQMPCDWAMNYSNVWLYYEVPIQIKRTDERGQLTKTNYIVLTGF